MLMFVPRKPGPLAGSRPSRPQPEPPEAGSAQRAQPAQPDAAALALRVAAGDRLALEEVYRREAGTVYRYALALCGNPAWAADATQDAFMSFAQRASGFDAARGSLGAYLAGAARHSLLALWRLHRQEVPLADDGQAEAPDESHPAAATDTDASPETLMVRAQSSSVLWSALRALPLPMREALVLVDLQERAYAEAAQIAGIELNTLRTRLHRARLKLAERLRGPAGPVLQPEDLS